ncbi:hypothetical protein RRF57_001946 [Xylaria bambusicola]|uniref:Major facilitator superfamily (MFS) profile domain-containing protein n=1 Tax=Xylaria bambusicola TaxID=326684 RepID=A0AAN7UJI2_9PEZI
MLGFHNRVTFDDVPQERTAKEAGLDFSPLPRVSGRSFVMGLFVSMGGLIFGHVIPHVHNHGGSLTGTSYDTGQISGFLEMPDFLQRFGEYLPDDEGNYSWKFTSVRSGLIVGLLSIGTLVGALIAAPIADRIGRRLSISLWCAVVSIGFVIQIAANDAYEQIVVGRLVAGFGVGALSLLVPM